MSTTIVIGAAGGIGSALCRMIAERGGRVVMCGRQERPLQDLSREIGGEVEVVDATDFAATQQLFERVEKRHGQIDGAVNLAGSILLKPAHSTSADEWDATIHANLRTAFSVVRAASQVMARHNRGSIVLLSSAAGRFGLANHEAISAAKAGVVGLALSAAATYAPRGIRVNVVAPGLINTPLAARIVDNAASRKASEAMHPLGRIGEADDVARTIDFLLNSAQSFLTGQVVGVDGGLATVRSK